MELNSQKTQKIMISAGEASGDMHGAGLVTAMLKDNPKLSFFGMGGKKLSLAGVEILCNAENIAVMGLTEICSKIKEILATLKLLKHELKKRNPSLLILVDFADFNLRLAKEAKKLNIPVFYYITPKVWVWRKGRVRKLSRLIDCAGVILPFEENYLKNRGVNAHYVGSPVLDSVTTVLDRFQFCQKYGINPQKAVVGILPGSRKKEVSFLLPIFLEAAKRMQKKYAKDIVFVIPLASTLKQEDLDRSGFLKYEHDLEILILSHDKYEMMASCDAVVAASGTVTLELAILNIPMIVAYKFTPISYLIGKILIHIPYFSLVNIIANKEVVTELLQDQVSPAAVELELARILFDDGAKNTMINEFSKIRNKLGKPGASEKAARLAIETIRRNND